MPAILCELTRCGLVSAWLKRKGPTVLPGLGTHCQRMEGRGRAHLLCNQVGLADEHGSQVTVRLPYCEKQKPRPG
jgi:hypothetical protein